MPRGCGPSGCGKTTLLRLAAGFETPDAGTIALGGQVLAGDGTFVPPEDRNIGIVFQSYALWPHLSVARNIAYPLEARRIPAAERRSRPPEALYDRPADCFVAGFVGDGAVIPVSAAGPLTPDGIAVEALGQRIAARADAPGPTHLCIRPEQVAIDPEGPVRARVRACTYQGGRFRLVLDTASETLVAHAPARARTGEEIGLRLHSPWAFRDGAAPPPCLPAAIPA